MFEIVEVETINFCNNDCSFCPANINCDQREHIFMPDELVQKIIHELAGLNYCGQVNLFSQNEPFLDSRICDIAADFRRALPYTRLVIYTNCLLMTVESFSKIISCIDYMVCNLYYPLSDCVEATVSECLKYAEQMGIPEKVEVRYRKKNDVLTTKGGLAPNKTILSPHPDFCILPFRQMVIKATGNVVLCCNDVYEYHVLGNVRTETLGHIWRSDIYEQYRKIISEGRCHIDICAACDVDWRKQKGLAWLQ